MPQLTRRPRRALAAAATLTLAAGLGAVALPASADDDTVEIERIVFDPVGSDRGREYVVLENDSDRSINLRGWTLTDRAGHRFTLPSVSVPADRSITVRYARGTNTSRTVYTKNPAPIWNNGGDGATLRSAGGSVEDRCGYSGRGRSTDC